MNYHNHPALSSSQVACFLQCRIEWWHTYKAKDWPRKKPTEAMEFGTLIHALLEVGCDLDSLDVICKPDGIDFRTSEGKAWKAINAGRSIINAEDYRLLMLIREHAMASDFVNAVLETGEPEKELFWVDDIFGPCRAKIDSIGDVGLIDWKTTSKKTERQFVYEILDRNYDVRISLYRRGLRAHGYLEPRTYFVAINTTSGEILPYEMPTDWLDDAEARLIMAVDEMQRFDLKTYLNREPRLLRQPRFSELSFD